MIKIMFKSTYKDMYEQMSQYLKEKVEVMLENNKLKARVKEVEDSYEKASGMKIRVETTKVFAKFDKKEMVLMMAGVQSLLKSANYHDDMEYYIGLIKKIQNYIDHMEDEDGI